MTCSKRIIQFLFNFRYDLKLIKCYALIVGSTFVTYSLPVSVFLALLFGARNLEILLKVQVISGALATLNNSINPFVYFYSQKPIRKHFYRLMRRGSMRRHKREIIRQIAFDIGPVREKNSHTFAGFAIRMKRTSTMDALPSTHKKVELIPAIARFQLERRNSSCPNLNEMQ